MGEKLSKNNKTSIENNFIKKNWDFPGGPVVRQPSCNAGDASLIPGQGTEIPHAAGQLSPHCTTREKPTHRS